MAALLRLCWLIVLLCAVPFGAVAAEPASVRLLVSNPAPYLGEEVVVTLEVRTSPRPPGPLAPIWPSLDSSATADLPTLPSRIEEDGRPVLVQAVQRSLRPLHTGQLALGNAGVSMAGQTYRAPEIELRVLPLPERGRPDGFAGAIGQIKMRLEYEGRGNREIRLILSGNAALDNFPVPHAELGSGERLIPLDDATVGDAPLERTRTLRYLYLPGGDHYRGRILFRLPVFDPIRRTYVVHQAGIDRLPAWSRHGVLLLAGLAVLYGLALLYRKRMPRTVEEALERIAGRPAHELCRAEIAELLRAQGGDAVLLAELDAYWQALDLKTYAPPQLRDEQPPTRAALRRQHQLLRRLARLGRWSDRAAPQSSRSTAIL